MKKLLALAIALFVICDMMAQDLIKRSDDSTIEAKVLEISPELVKYKRFSNLDGPTYVLPISQILYIEYQNGERENFSQLVDSEKNSVTQTPEPQYVAKRYNIGDLYENGDIRGVVCAVSDSGTHGLIISLEQAVLHWSTFEKGDYRLVGASSTADGAENMAAVERYIAQTGLSWNYFPAFKWCRELGEGWYLPSIDEWLTITFNFNGGGPREIFNRSARNHFNSALHDNGGKRLDRICPYFSSTEDGEDKAMATDMDSEQPYVMSLKKSGITYLIRAVRKF